MSPGDALASLSMRSTHQLSSTFRLVVIFPIMASAMAFGCRWGTAGFIIASLLLLNVTSLAVWLRYRVCRYVMRIVSAWGGALLGFHLSTPAVLRGPPETLEEVLACVILGWIAGWGGCVLCEFLWRSNESVDETGGSTNCAPCQDGDLSRVQAPPGDDGLL